MSAVFGYHVYNKLSYMRSNFVKLTVIQIFKIARKVQLFKLRVSVVFRYDFLSVIK